MSTNNKMKTVMENMKNHARGFVTVQEAHKAFKEQQRELRERKRKIQEVKQRRLGKRMEGEMVVTSFDEGEDLEWRRQWSHHVKNSTIPDRVKTVKQIECIEALSVEGAQMGKHFIDKNMSGKRKVAVNAHREEERKLYKSLKKMGVYYYG